jgi:hypothetical protein
VILFLDFDGVLHPVFPRKELPDAENQLFSYLPRLESVLRDFPAVQIVISSSWREGRPWGHVIKAFSADIADRIIGATPVVRCNEPPYPKHQRHGEVMLYLENNNLTAADWVALDDNARIYPKHCRNLVLCADGFRYKEEKALRRALGKIGAA